MSAYAMENVWRWCGDGVEIFHFRVHQIAVLSFSEAAGALPRVGAWRSSAVVRNGYGGSGSADLGTLAGPHPIAEVLVNIVRV